MTASSAPPGPGLFDVLALLPAYADEVALGSVRHTHRAVADRSFGVVNRVGADIARPAQVLHDGIAGTLYAATGLGLRAVGHGLARLGRAGVGPRVDETPSGRVLHSAVNGLVGARLRDERPHLALGTTVRVGGRTVPLDPASLAEAFPDASGRVVVFVHGLGEHEGHWARDRHRVGSTYGATLAAEGGWTPVHLRVNSGLPVAENGVALTSLLQDLVDAWPTTVERLAMVGHSMGGLVVRAACAVRTAHERPWTERVTDVIMLGTPHLGADPARGLPDMPTLPHVRQRLVSASPWSERRFLRTFPDTELLRIRRAGRFSLVNHPEVHDALRGWLS